MKYEPKKPPEAKPVNDDALSGKYGALPLDEKRRALSRQAFEEGLEKIMNDEACRAVVQSNELDVWWKGLAPLTPAERRAVYLRVKEFAVDRLRRTGQLSMDDAS